MLMLVTCDRAEYFVTCVFLLFVSLPNLFFVRSTDIRSSVFRIGCCSRMLLVFMLVFMMMFVLVLL
jgi:hypothetical protein